MGSTTQSEWNISTDIYSIVDTVDKLKAKYVEDENETTLALGIFGFLGDIEAKKIQTSTIMAGELGNEMFPARAKLNKNVLAHAVYCNVEGINATPARITTNIGIKVEDLNLYMQDNTFIFSKNTGIYIGEYEYHLDYDIILKRVKPAGSDNYIYTATYDMDEVNNISQIKSAYLMQPVTQSFNNFTYIFFITELHQVHINEISETLVSDSIIENKSYTFNFTDQLADFEVYVTDNGIRTRLTPLFYGSSIEVGVDKYCWYLYINDNTIRLSFDPNSYTPGLNSTIDLVVRTTVGSEANFQYEDNPDNAIYCDFISQFAKNKKITCYVRCADDSANGKNRKSIDELKALIPKMAMSRGYITTEADLNNYFNLISDENNIIKLQKKVDNQLERIWYAYYIVKDEENNIVPTNTFQIQVAPDSEYMVEVEDGRYIIPAGTNFCYDQEKGYAEYIDTIPEPFSDEFYQDKNKYYYKLIHNIIINVDPLYAAYYMTLVSHDSYFNYYWVNDKSFLGFTTIMRNHFERKLLSDKDTYTFTFKIMQSVFVDYGLVTADQDGNVTDCKIKCFLVLYNQGEPYRYQECEITGYTSDMYTTSWKAELETDNKFDTKNRIHLTNLYDYGYNSIDPGYFENNCEAYVYIAAKFDSVYMDENGLLDKLCPGLYTAGYSLVDIYQVEGGCTLFENYTGVMNTKIVMNKSEDLTRTNYDVFAVPMVGYHYFQNEDKVAYLTNALSDKKDYIDYCLQRIENTMDIDFKFFNTYGFAQTYTIGDKDQTPLGPIDIDMNFRLKLINSSDMVTKDSIVLFIKEYIEDLNELGDLHIPNLIHDVKEVYKDTIEYIEFMNFNNNRLGVNHIELRDITDPQIVPEFINVRNSLAEDGETLKPAINIEVVLD